MNVGWGINTLHILVVHCVASHIDKSIRAMKSNANHSQLAQSLPVESFKAIEKKSNKSDYYCRWHLQACSHDLFSELSCNRCIIFSTSFCYSYRSQDSTTQLSKSAAKTSIKPALKSHTLRKDGRLSRTDGKWARPLFKEYFKVYKKSFACRSKKMHCNLFMNSSTFSYR